MEPYRGRDLPESRLNEIKLRARKELTRIIIGSIQFEITDPVNEKIAYFDTLKPLMNSQERDLGFMLQDIADAILDGNLDLESAYPEASKELAKKLADIVRGDSRLAIQKSSRLDTFAKLLKNLNPAARWDINGIDLDPHRKD